MKIKFKNIKKSLFSKEVYFRIKFYQFIDLNMHFFQLYGLILFHKFIKFVEILYEL